MQLTTPQAAALTGKSRSTIWRACKTGKVSATKGEGGDYLIDPAELERAFGTLQPCDPSQPVAVEPTATAPATVLLQQELTHTREQLERERHLYDRDRHAWHDERVFLRRLVEQHTEQLRLLTHEREDPEMKRAGWWSRLIGRR